MIDVASMRTTDALANYSVQIANDASEYIAMKVFRPVLVDKSVGKFYQYTLSNLLAKDSTTAYGSEAARHDYATFTQTFSCALHSLKGFVSEGLAKEMDVAVADMRADVLAQNMHALLLELEIAAVASAMDANNFPSARKITLTSGGGADSGQWLDDDADIIKQMDTARVAVKSACGKMPNKLALSDSTFLALKRHPQFRNFFQHTTPGYGIDAVAAALGLEEILVGSARKNTANVAQAASISSVWDDDALLFFSGSDSLRGMDFGKMFLVRDMSVAQIDRPEVGHGLAAYDLQTTWQWGLSPGSVVSSSDADFLAGYLFTDCI